LGTLTTYAQQSNWPQGCPIEVEVVVPVAYAHRRAFAFDGADAAAGLAVAAQ
jgi:hypothetical protein